MKRNVKKLKLLKQKEGNGLTLDFEYTDAAGAPATGGDDFKGLIHNDLYQALQSFRVHYMILLGYIQVDDILQLTNEQLLIAEKAHISGYSLNDASNGSETIVLTGHHIGPRGKAIINNTPPELLECSQEARYPWMDDLLAKLRVLKGEEDQYLEGEKRGEPIKKEGASPQMNMFKQGGATDEKVTKMQIAEPAESVPIGDGTGKTTPLAKADKESMKAVAGESNEQLNGGAKKKGTPNKKRPQQTPANPGGDILEEGEQ